MNKSLSFRSAIAFFLALSLTACGTGASEVGEATFEIDPTLSPVTDAIDFIEGSGTRPVGCMADDAGNHADFVEDEVIVTVDDSTELDEIAARLNGDVLFEVDPNQSGLLEERSPIFALLRVDAPEATPEEVAALAVGRADGAGHLRFCSQRALNTLAAIARESFEEGTRLGANFLLSPDEMSGRDTSEASTTVLSPPFGRGFSNNAFELPYMDRATEDDDDWVQDIGTAEAARMVHQVVGEATGRNRVDLMIIDGGFLPDDFPEADIIPAGTFGQINPPNICSNGAECPWHGTNVASAALGRFNDSRGGAGPAGPVVDADSGEETSFVNPIFVQTPRMNFWDIIEFVVLRVPEIYTRFPDIANISASADVPAGACLLGACHILDEFGELLRRSGILVFASAGNDAADVDAERCGSLRVVCFERAYRIPCEMPGVICVGGLANDRNMRAEQRSGASVTGSAWGSKQQSGDDGSVDIYAPYGMWLQETPARGAAPVVTSNRAKWTQGTSFSSPFTAGVAALVKAANPRLGANEIWEVLRDSAHTKGPGASINRWVNAFGAVKRALGGAVPLADILQPTDGSRFSLGTSVPLRCDVDDADGMDGVTVTWSSDLDGAVGAASSSTGASRLREGVHQITCTASDGRFAVSDTVEISVENDAPTVEITSPVAGTELYAGNAIWARARVGDVNGNFEEVYWQLFTSTDLPTGWTGTGAEVTIPRARLAPGRYTLVATGYDTEGARNQDRVTLNIRPALSDNPPSIDNVVVTPLTTNEYDSGDSLFTVSCPVDMNGDGRVDHQDLCRQVRITVYASDDHDPTDALRYEWTVRGPHGDFEIETSDPSFVDYYPLGNTEVSVVVYDTRGEAEGSSNPQSVTIKVTTFI
jgi:serine protease